MRREKDNAQLQRNYVSWEWIRGYSAPDMQSYRNKSAAKLYACMKRA